MTAVALRLAAVPAAARLAGLALVYFVAAELSLVFAMPPGYATAVWLPSGIAVAAVILWGARCWPGVWLGAALANFTIGLSVPAALGIATGNTLEALCAGTLAARLVDPANQLRRPEAVFSFAVAAAGASTIAASTGTGVLWLLGAVDGGALLANWYTWWQGDTTGILVVTPCVLAWASVARMPATPRHANELTLFALLFAAALTGVFAQSPANDALRPVAFLTMPFFAWAACRYDERVVTTSVLLGAGLAIWCTVNGRGPFAGAALNDSLLTLQAFVSIAALIALALGALTYERERAARTLRVSNDNLDEAVRAQDAALGARDRESARVQALAHVGVWTWDSGSGRMTWTDELCRICGIEPGSFEGSFAAYLARVDARDRERLRSLFQAALFEGRSWEAMQRVVRPDGAVRVLHGYCRVASRARGRTERMQGFCIDVTARVWLEQVQATLHEVGMMLARAPGAQEAVHATLRILCDKLDWRSARYWRVDAAGAGLHTLAAHPEADATTPRELRADQVSALPVRAWRERQATWGPAGDNDAARPGPAAAIPVLAGGTTLGVIELRDGAHLDGQHELRELATSMGALLGEYLHRTRSEQQVRDAEAKRRQMLRRLLDAQDAERRQLAAELRDAVAQPLAAARAELGDVRLEGPLAAARQMIAQLRPGLLEDNGLLAALRAYAVRFERRTGVAVAVIGAEEAPEIAPRLETALFQIARDAMDNSARHARARKVVVELEAGAGAVSLCVRDDGEGFDAHARPAAGARGLAQMRERAESVGGNLRVESAPGRGTRLSVRVRG